MKCCPWGRQGGYVPHWVFFSLYRECLVVRSAFLQNILSNQRVKLCTALYNFVYLFTDLLTITPHTPTPEPVKYNKRDGQWYSHDGVDAKDTQQRQG